MLLLILQTDYGEEVSARSTTGDSMLAMTNERGRKKMLTKVSSLMFSPS
jgi:hypothetical protein